MNKLAIDIGETFFGSSGNVLSTPEGVGTLTTNIVRALFSLAGIILIVILIAGGIGIIAGAGNNNPEQAAKGKQAATSAVIGFVIVFASYWIVQLIEILTGLKLL